MVRTNEQKQVALNSMCKHSDKRRSQIARSMCGARGSLADARLLSTIGVLYGSLRIAKENENRRAEFHPRRRFALPGNNPHGVVLVVYYLDLNSVQYDVIPVLSPRWGFLFQSRYHSVMAR